MDNKLMYAETAATITNQNVLRRRKETLERIGQKVEEFLDGEVQKAILRAAEVGLYHVGVDLPDSEDPKAFRIEVFSGLDKLGYKATIIEADTIDISWA